MIVTGIDPGSNDNDDDGIDRNYDYDYADAVNVIVVNRKNDIWNHGCTVANETVIVIVDGMRMIHDDDDNYYYVHGDYDYGDENTNVHARNDPLDVYNNPHSLHNY